MNKVHLLGANRSYDRDVQTVSVNQVVVLDSYDSYVVYEAIGSVFTRSSRTFLFSTSEMPIMAGPAGQ